MSLAQQQPFMLRARVKVCPNYVLLLYDGLYWLRPQFNTAMSTTSLLTKLLAHHSFGQTLLCLPQDNILHEHRDAECHEYHLRTNLPKGYANQIECYKVTGAS